ncbi:HAMP domain-containing histidine kinase [Altererythrobacter sp. SALINAS58]|uniref:sensor histidine kinase n=1 Tax=Alteripontixanthobacter muriae TaxID=2705546 RepID=UPI001575F43A|nr:HAMP domain-containing sensor histidine kinase [Alteripontixanthobacter muriae]NTZ42438.1 HAMP domain-containing histidine kinase [Alteripontixanthobacter muriae]
MQIDDRLATVTRARTNGAMAAHTQYRQLLDLLGASEPAADSALLDEAHRRLAALSGMISAPVRAAILREPWLRIRNASVLERMAEMDPDIAAAAIARADLPEADWLALVERLPVRARGFLRLRKDLPLSVVTLLERLGVHDRGLPCPSAEAAPAKAAPSAAVSEKPARPSLQPRRQPPEAANDVIAAAAEQPDSAIGALVKRIAAFKQAREDSTSREDISDGDPAGASASARPPREVNAFDFATDAEGRIDRAEPQICAMIYGMRFAEILPKGLVANGVEAFQRRQIIKSCPVVLTGAPAIAGSWRLDATPIFTIPGGSFSGYAGRLRRASDLSADKHDGDQNDRLRQLLHELRTPVNAIQGFAEVIQQQLFGPVPHDYRALAAEIAGDAARILSGFDALDRLARLESGALEPEAGSSNLAEVLRETAEQLAPSLQSRSAAFSFASEAEDVHVPIADEECRALIWRLLATLAGSANAGTEITISIKSDARGATVVCDLPDSLTEEGDIFSFKNKASTGALNVGMFGTGFVLRLCRAEAAAAGGSLDRTGNTVRLRLPLLNAAFDRQASSA